MQIKTKNSLKHSKQEIKKIEINPIIKSMIYSSKKYRRVYGLSLIRAKKQNQNLNCFFCNKNLNCSNYSIDHYIPKSKGGAVNDLNNLKISCKKCNSRKADIHPIEARSLLNFAFENDHYQLDLKFILKNNSQMLIEYWNLYNVKVKFLIFCKVYFQNLFMKNDKYSLFIEDHNWHDFDGQIKKPLKRDQFVIWKTIPKFITQKIFSFQIL